MKNVRQIHLFLGTFFAPAIIFFAFSGLLQVFGLHESKGKDAAPPIGWIAEFAEIHKNQHLRTEMPRREEALSTSNGHEPSAHAGPDQPQLSSPSWALKAFVLLMAIGLIASSLIGIYIALQNPRTRRNAWISLALGAVVPTALLYL